MLSSSVKFIILFIITISFSYASTTSFETSKNLVNLTNLPSNTKVNTAVKSSKTYKELINTLSSNPNPDFALYLAVIYLNGINIPDTKGEIVEKNTKKSITWFNNSIKYGNYNASQILGSLYMYHIDFQNVANRFQKAKFYLELALKHKKYESATALAELYIKHLNNIKKGIEILKVGAEHNIATSQLLLAMIYNWGYSDKTITISPNKTLAQALLTKACTNPKKTKKVDSICHASYVTIKKENNE